MTLKNKYQTGRSMIEMLGVLAIVGILSAGGIAGYSMAMEKQKTNTLIERMHRIAMQGRTFYNGEYTGISKQNLINSGSLTNTDFQNPFGGNIGIFYLYDTTFYVSATNLSTAACVQLLKTDWGNPGTITGFDFRDNNNTLYQYGWGWGVDGGLPVSNESAVRICKDGMSYFALRVK